VYELKALPKFLRQFGKFSPADQNRIREELRKIAADPSVGHVKKDPLAGIRVHKWKLKHQTSVASYRV